MRCHQPGLQQPVKGTETMEKKEALTRWINLEENQEILPYFTPLAADAKGSTFGACGIRISGNPKFIDAVLSRLKDLLAAEAGSTRLSLSRQPVKPVSITSGDAVVDKKWNNAEEDAETCYIQIRERTAKTRARKVRERTNPLPNFGDDKGEKIPSMIPAVLPDTFQEELKPVKKVSKLSSWTPPGGAVRADGEVIYDDDNEVLN